MSTERDSFLTNGRRRTATWLCVLLALSGAGWIVRDLTVAGQGADLWRHWCGAALRPGGDTVWATSALDPLLVLGAPAAAAAVRRRAPAPAVAAGALGSLAAGTALLRLPVLWTAAARLPVPDDRLLTWTRATAAAQLVVAAVLCAVAAGAVRRRGRPGRPGGRRSDALPEVASSAYGVVHAVPYGADPGPAGRPYKGPAAVAGLLLAAAGLALTAREVHHWVRLGGEAYGRRLTGGTGAVRALLEPPADWQTAVLAVLALAVAAAAFRRAAWARPAAAAVGALLAVHGAVALALAVRAGQFGRLAVLPGGAQLGLAAAALSAAAGPLVLIAAARPGLPPPAADPDEVRAYGSAPGEARPPHAPPPPTILPPGW
ncbi:hypothetical protein [Streptomyces endophytica]|uniref:Uncharacterized protein n=1 Tax=Streptomyces endophytica TaxID=2991496 RepID=A0ABY6P825_9ACTN|nr:hypothetical protein [Streptomyces endophytica]UZJ29748.1 hypothetical protein OJ254_03900 [Streptomyces endophytica]